MDPAAVTTWLGLLLKAGLIVVCVLASCLGFLFLSCGRGVWRRAGGSSSCEEIRAETYICKQHCIALLLLLYLYTTVRQRVHSNKRYKSKAAKATQRSVTYKMVHLKVTPKLSALASVSLAALLSPHSTRQYVRFVEIAIAIR